MHSAGTEQAPWHLGASLPRVWGPKGQKAVPQGAQPGTHLQQDAFLGATRSPVLGLPPIEHSRTSCPGLGQPQSGGHGAQ